MSAGYVARFKANAPHTWRQHSHPSTGFTCQHMRQTLRQCTVNDWVCPWRNPALPTALIIQLPIYILLLDYCQFCHACPQPCSAHRVKHSSPTRPSCCQVLCSVNHLLLSKLQNHRCFPKASFPLPLRTQPCSHSCSHSLPLPAPGLPACLSPDTSPLWVVPVLMAEP